MPRRTDAKRRMVDAARELIRERGLNATALSDVLERSGAPRGSVYFHFPGGKKQLAVEAAESHAAVQVALIDELADRADSAAALVRSYVTAARDGMVNSLYSRGCGVAPLVLEGSEELARTGRDGLTAMVDRIATHLNAFGLQRTAARELADAVIAGVEGAMVTSRAFRSPSPFDAVQTSLLAHVATL
jgi:TetR/AcrR family transcriptional repressor of lmrAB and yxaGH operons